MLRNSSTTNKTSRTAPNKTKSHTNFFNGTKFQVANRPNPVHQKQKVIDFGRFAFVDVELVHATFHNPRTRLVLQPLVTFVRHISKNLQVCCPRRQAIAWVGKEQAHRMHEKRQFRRWAVPLFGATGLPQKLP